jgi:16S rRNA (guanine527-N7)-methyltransferase
VDCELLKKSADSLDLVVTENQLGLFALLFDELIRWNKQINLTALEKSTDIIVKHFIDSLSIAPLLPQDARVLDIGSGAGFPALPLAIARPDLHITSIDAVNKKIVFQKHVVRLLRISSVEALHCRAEELALKRAHCYDFVTSRAFSRLTFFVNLAKPFINEKGKIISMRGAEGVQESHDAAVAIASTGFRVEEMLQYDLPLKMGRRYVIVIAKVP